MSRDNTPTTWTGATIKRYSPQYAALSRIGRKRGLNGTQRYAVWQLHGAYGDRPDGLNLIGDGQQTIYPGGYTLSEANISIAGRGVIMTKNYRNTIEIADLALSLVAGRW